MLWGFIFLKIFVKVPESVVRAYNLGSRKSESV